MTTRAIWVLIAFGLILMALGGCGDSTSDEDLRAEVVIALDAFAAELVADRPENAEEYVRRLQAYLQEHPSFFGSAAALLDRWGIVVSSPYVYRTDDGFASTDLATPSYKIEQQEWLLAPLEANAGVWTDPYFDEGGGNIWMVTRSLPVRDAEGIFAIITTDLPVEAPDK